MIQHWMPPAKLAIFGAENKRDAPGQPTVVYLCQLQKSQSHNAF